MADVDIKVVRRWVEELRVKREQLRRCRKENLRLVAILNNAIEKNRILYRELRRVKFSGEKRWVAWLADR
jgi:hypothetical protein